MDEIKLQKIQEKLKDEKYISKILKEQQQIENDYYKIFNFEFTINGQPENYSRERKGRGKHFYNPKGKKMQEIRDQLRKTQDEKTRKYLKKVFENEHSEYYVELEIKYYIQIQSTSSLKDSVLKELGFIKPTIRPDIDNYDKFILDTLHEIVYGDDSHVVKVSPEKLYSLNPRTEIKAKLVITKE